MTIITNLWPIFLFFSCKKICLSNFVSIKQNAGDCGRCKENAGESGWKFRMRVKVQKFGWLGNYAFLTLNLMVLQPVNFLSYWLTLWPCPFFIRQDEPLTVWDKSNLFLWQRIRISCKIYVQKFLKISFPS